jgi:hypothetical protein
MALKELWNELRRPCGIISIASIVIATAVAYYFYEVSLIAERITYLVEQVQVVDQTQLTNGHPHDQSWRPPLFPERATNMAGWARRSTLS